MNRKRLTKLICAGVLCASAAILAQQKVAVVAPSEARPNFGRVVDRPEGAMPKVPAGFTVELYADDIPGARMMEFAPNGDLFVSQPSQNAIMILRDTNKDGKPDERFTYAQGPPPAPRGGGGGGAQAGPPPGGPPAGGRGAAPSTTAELVQPFGLAFHEGYLYVGNTNSVA